MSHIQEPPVEEFEKIGYGLSANPFQVLLGSTLESEYHHLKYRKNPKFLLDFSGGGSILSLSGICFIFSLQGTGIYQGTAFIHRHTSNLSTHKVILP